LRGRLRHSVFFAAYMATVVFGVLIAIRPDFYNWRQWLIWQTVQVALKVGILLELGTHIFSPFPGALATMRGAVVVLLLATTVGAFISLQAGVETLPDFALRAVPVTSQGVAWGYALLLALAIWFMVPLDSWRKAILGGMAVYMMAFTVVLEIVSRWRGMRRPVSNLNMGAYVLLLVYWNWAAWRPDSDDDADVDRIRREIPLRLAARGPRP